MSTPSRSRLSVLPPDWLYGRACLGPIGLLATLFLSLGGAFVYGLDIMDTETARPKLLQKINGQYIDGRQIPADKADEELTPIELIFESKGFAALEFNLLDALTPNEVYVLTCIPGGERPMKIPGAVLIRQLVLDNQVMVGSVNAARDHFQMAVDDLTHAQLLWGDYVA